MESRVTVSRFDVVAIGASAGGIEALHVVVNALPADLPASVLIVQHLDPHRKSMLAYLLGRCSRLPVVQATHNEVMRSGTVYVAPPDMHLLVANGCLELSHSRLVHFTRPSVDLLLESVAGTFGHRAIGVILTGSGTDGATGIRAIKRMGGVTIVQEPATAAHRSMPNAAEATGCADFVLPLDRIGAKIVELVGTSPAEAPANIG